MMAEKTNTGERREAKLKLKSSRVKGGELRRVEVKLREGLSWVGRGCGGLLTVDRGLVGEELERQRRIRGSG
jgi:hypothetical protein